MPVYWGLSLIVSLPYLEQRPPEPEKEQQAQKKQQPQSAERSPWQDEKKKSAFVFKYPQTLTQNPKPQAQRPSYWVYVGSSVANRKSAHTLRDTLISEHFPAQIRKTRHAASKQAHKTQPRYQVMIGPFEKRQQALENQQFLNKLGYKSSVK